MEAAIPSRLCAAASPLPSVPRTSFAGTLAMLLGVFLPTVAKGVIIRRPAMLAVAEWLDLDRHAIRVMQRLRHEYGSGPVLLRIPGRRVAIIMDPEDVRRILQESPDPFATATKEKIAALAHFEPKGVLISAGSERAERRRFNERVLEPERPLHTLAKRFREITAGEVRPLRGDKILDWRQFSEAWFRIVRRVIFGDSARQDNELSSIMAKLRFTANWAFLRPQRRELRERLLARIRHYLDQAQTGSLAGCMAVTPKTGRTAPEHQVPQWLFAFDGAGIAVFRSLALLASHPEQGSAAREEAGRRSDLQQMPYLRAAVQDCLRLWPTTPLILRESTSPTIWRSGVMPAGTTQAIFTPFFHRDAERLPYADHFCPELWLTEGREPETHALIPFSAGPAECPGRQLVLLLATAALAELLSGPNLRLRNSTKLSAGRPVPATLNHYRLQFEVMGS